MESFKETYVQVASLGRVPISTYGLVVKSFSCPTFPDLKDLPKKSDPESSGDVETFPSVAYFKAYNIQIDLAYQGAEGSSRTAIVNFLNYIQGAEFSILDVYQNIGKRCRYASYGNDGRYICRGGIETLEFKITLKVNNPTGYGVFLPNGTIGAYILTDAIVYWSDGSTNSYTAGDLITKNLGAINSFAIIEPLGGLRGGTEFHGMPRVIVAGDNRIDTQNLIRFTSIR